MPTTKQNPETLDFEKVWLMFKESDKQMQETGKQIQETSKQMQEMKKELDRRSEESDKNFQQTREFFVESERHYREEMSRLERAAQRRINKLEELFTGQWGKLVESLVEGKLIELLKNRGIDVQETYTRVVSERRDMEIDIIAANGKDVVVVEVKTTLKLDKVDDFLEKLEKFRSTFRRFNEENVFGAIAYLRDDTSAAKYAQKSGLFVIKATSDSAKIVNSKTFKPRTW